jgi:hypothetical protein
MDYKIPLQRKIYGGDLGPDLLNFFNEKLTTKSATSSIIGPLTPMISLQSQISDAGPGDCSVTPASENPFGQLIHATLSLQGHCLITNQ